MKSQSLTSKIVRAAAAAAVTASFAGTVFAGVADARTGDPSQWGLSRKVNEYEGQHRKVNEYEGQHRKVNEYEGQHRKVNEYEGQHRKVNEYEGQH